MSIEMEQAGILIVDVKGEELRGLYMARASARQATIDKHEKEIGRLRKVVEGIYADRRAAVAEVVRMVRERLDEIEAHRAAIARERCTSCEASSGCSSTPADPISSAPSSTPSALCPRSVDLSWSDYRPSKPR